MPLVTRFIASQSRKLPPAPHKDLRGRVYIITGANSGIGLEAAYQLAACEPAKLILAVRNLETGEAAKKSIIQRFPKTANAIEVWHVDMTDFASLHTFAIRCQSLDRLDGVAMNAGIQGSEFEYTKDGHDKTVQVNAIAPFILTMLLIPVLRLTTPLNGGSKDELRPRVLFTSSLTGEDTKTKLLDPQNPLRGLDDQSRCEKEGVMARYFQSKLVLQAIVEGFIQLFPDLLFASVEPGLVDSPFHTYLSGSGMVLVRKVIGRTPEEGARGLTIAMLTLEHSVPWFQDCRIMQNRFDWLRTTPGQKFARNLIRDCSMELEKVAPGALAVAGLKKSSMM